MGSEHKSNITAEVEKNLDDFFGEGGGDDDQEADSAPSPGSTIEVDRRLDDFFSEDDSQPALKDDPPASEQLSNESVESTPAEEKTVNIASSPENELLKDLKSVVLSLEWEITDEVMHSLGEEIAKLEKDFLNDKIVVAFLQLMGSLGKYVQKKKAEAHPDSISLLNSVYDNLETVVIAEDMSEAAKKKLLIGEVNKYKLLKEHIASAKVASAAKAEMRRNEESSNLQEEESYTPADDPPVADIPSDSSYPEMAAGETTGGADTHAIVSALEQIGQILQTELTAIREELKLLRKSQ
ncbi:hypothetical protein QUF76_12375 [Desulfobacterales bacterium HSG16]|nr:hypothetical protein [Desulfobacterales bacterium HSG16]